MGNIAWQVPTQIYILIKSYARNTLTFNVLVFDQTPKSCCSGTVWVKNLQFNANTLNISLINTY